MTQATNISEELQQVIEHSERRVQLINYVLAALLAIVLVWALYAAWRNSLQEKITSVNLAPDSVHVISPTALCPGDTLKVAYALDVEGMGVIVTDDSVKHENHTVKFSDARRDYIDSSSRSIYEDAWTIPDKPEMAIDDAFAWTPGQYTRYLSIAPSDAYVSRYIDPASFAINFTIKGNCS